MTRTFATARQLATSHPGAMLPCPGCGASVRADNLDKHLTKQHAAAAARVATGPARVTGSDRALEWQFVVVLVIALAIVSAVAAATGGKLTTTSVGIGVGVSLLLLTAVVVAGLGKFSAHLEIEGTRVQLHHALGLRTYALANVERIELGRTLTKRPEAGMQSYDVAEVDVDDGMYLRLVDGKRRITIGCRENTGFAKHWSSPCSSRAKPTRWIDLTLRREAMIALEYELAARGVLVVRQP